MNSFVMIAHDYLLKVQGIILKVGITNCTNCAFADHKSKEYANRTETAPT